MTARPRKAARGEVARRSIDRVQTGVRIEKRLLQVLKALAESHELTTQADDRDG